MIKADFYRYHGLGNDYLVMDPAFSPVPMTPRNIRLITDRHFGVGSDGILYGPLPVPAGMGRDNDASGRPDAKIYFQIWNPDGSEAEKSGNGIRIFAQYLLDQRIVRESEFTLQTLGGKVFIEVLDRAENRLRVHMGKATCYSAGIPADLPAGEILQETLELKERSFQICCVNVGNPHCVIIQDQISAEETKLYGPAIETHPLFPLRTNVQFLKKRDAQTIQIEIWERGAGYTLASGSSCCAASVAAWRRGLVSPPVRVLMPGGEVTVGIDPLEVSPGNPFCAELSLSGTTEGISYGFFAPDLQRKLETGPPQT